MSKDSQEERELRTSDSEETRSKLDEQRLLELLEEGKRLLAEEEYQESARVLDRVIAADPLNLNALLACGRAKARSGKLGDAETALRQVIESEPAQADALYELALVVEAGGNRNEARDLLRRSLAADSGNSEARLVLGRLLWSEGDEAGALASYEAAAGLGPPNAKAHYSAGVVKRKLGDREAAATHLRRAAELEPENVEFLSALANVLVFQESYEETTELCDRILALSQDSVPARIYLGIAAAKLGDPGRAERLLREAISLDSKNTEAYCRLALLLLREERVGEAVKTAQEACEIGSGEAFPLLVLGQVSSEAGQPERAEQALRQYVRLEPADVTGWLQFSRVLADLDRQDEAEQALDTAYRKVAPAPQDLVSLGLAYDDLEAKKKARRCFRKAVRIAPPNRETRLELADLLRYRHRYAAEALAPLVRLDYRDIEVVLRLAWHLELSGARGRAKKILKRALRRSPEIAAFWLEYGKLTVAEDPHWPKMISRKSKAFAAFREAVRLDPEVLDARINLGKALYLAGRLDEAKETFHGAVVDFPDSPLSNEKLGVFLLHEEDPEEAIVFLERSVTLSHEGKASEVELVGRLLLLAEGQIDCAQYEKADATITKALEIRPNLGDALRLRGRSNLARGNHSAALTDLWRAVKGNEHDTEARLLLGAAQLCQDRNGALCNLEAALEQKPSDPRVQCAVTAALRRGSGSEDVLRAINAPPDLFFRLPTDHWSHLENSGVFRSEVLPDGARGFTRGLMKKLAELNLATQSSALEFRSVPLFLLVQHLARFAWNRASMQAILKFIQESGEIVSGSTLRQNERVHQLLDDLRRAGISAARYCHLRAKWLGFLTFRESKANPANVEVSEFQGALSIEEAQKIWVGQRLLLARRYATGFLAFLVFILVPPILMSLPGQWLGLEPAWLTIAWAAVVAPLIVVAAVVMATRRGIWVGIPILVGLGVGEWLLFSKLSLWHSLVDSEFYRLLAEPVSFQLFAVLSLMGILASWKVSRKWAAPLVGLTIALLAPLGFVRLLEGQSQIALEQLPILVAMLVAIDLAGTVVWKRYGLVRNPYVFENPMAPATWFIRVAVDSSVLLAVTLIATTGSWEILRSSLWVDTILASPFFERAVVLNSLGILGLSVLSVARFAIRPVVLLDGLLDYTVDFCRRTLESVRLLAEGSSRARRFPCLPTNLRPDHERSETSLRVTPRRPTSHLN